MSEALADFALTAGIVFASACIQGITGFAFGMVSMALLPYIMSVKTATPLVAVVAFVNVVAILFQMRHSIDIRKSRGLLVGTVAGVPVGVFFLARVQDDLVTKVLGAVLIAAAAQGLSIRTLPNPTSPPSPAWGPFLGVLGGIIGGAFNIGGAPIVLYVYRQKWPKETIVAVLQTVFCISLLYRIIIYVFTGFMPVRLCLTALLLMPFIIMGSWLGVRMQRKIDVGRLRFVVHVMLIVMGVPLLFR